MTIDKIKNMKNKILAISMAEPAIPVNPNSAATMSITKNVAAQPNINSSFLYICFLSDDMNIYYL